MCPFMYLLQILSLFKVSKNLWKKYGDQRIMDTPITEVMLHRTFDFDFPFKNIKPGYKQEYLGLSL